MKPLRILIFSAGLSMLTLGFVAMHLTGKPALLQGALTLGGAWIISGLFSLSAKWLWHGLGAAAVLALLALGRCTPALLRLGSDPGALYEVIAWIVSALVLGGMALLLTRERARRSREKLSHDHD